MSSQIMFFLKSKCDISDSNVSATASQGSAYAEFALNRNNISAWMTTGSVDADNTTWTVDMVDPHFISDILLIKHNFKAFTVKYWDGAAYQAFSTPIVETVNTDETNYYTFTAVSTTKLQIRITGTQTPNDDKFMYQFIASKLLGQLEGWPVVQNPISSRNKQKSKMLSGKLNIAENIGSFKCDLTVKEWKVEDDIDIVETLYDSNEGFLVWLGGGDETQFWSARKGFRNEDLFLMKCTNDYEPTYRGGHYLRGLDMKITLEEVID